MTNPKITEAIERLREARANEEAALAKRDASKIALDDANAAYKIAITVTLNVKQKLELIIMAASEPKREQ